MLLIEFYVDAGNIFVLHAVQGVHNILDLGFDDDECRVVANAQEKWTPKIGQPCKRPLVQAASLAAS